MNSRPDWYGRRAVGMSRRFADAWLRSGIVLGLFHDTDNPVLGIQERAPRDDPKWVVIGRVVLTLTIFMCLIAYVRWAIFGR